MSQLRHPGPLRRALVALAVATGLVVPVLGAAPRAAADTAEDVATAVEHYDEARAELATAEATRRDADSQQAEAQRQRDDAAAELARRQGERARQRSRYGRLSAEYYVHQGQEDDDVNRSMYSALSVQRERLDAAKQAERDATEALEDAEDELAARTKTLDRANEDRDHALAAADEAGAAADAAIAGTGARDLPAIAYSAYRSAAAAANEADPGCDLPAAVLAGLGRLASGHGRNQGASSDHLGHVAPALRGLRGTTSADTDGGEIDGDPTADPAVGPLQLSVDDWRASATDGDGDGTADPDDLFDAAATTATILCRGSGALDTYASLQRTVRSLLGDSAQTQVALGTARRYARTEGLELGDVPADPRAAAGDGAPQFDVSDTDLAPGDVLGMIDWAMTRIGTPYSQCLGIDARPQDPECPPGTNRFGAGFFDCSGFVSSAYRRIGITVPATTYAMDADPRFMATRVADRIDLSVMEPGDVFLMDGHTGMYVGGGMIVHAVSGGLTYQPVPGWVANGTYAVLRPSLLL
jgi:cell wall-associated NlpC family hydrolase